MIFEPYSKQVSYNGRSYKVIVNNDIEDDFWRRYEANKWETEILDFLIKNKKGGNFLDIGSWIGPVSLLMAQQYEKVIAVDFDPKATLHFQKNIELNNIDNIECINIGLSDKKGSVKLDENYFGSSETSLYYTNNDKGVEIELTTFTDLFSKIKDNNKISIIKVDIEGAEFKILKDVYKVMSKQKITTLISYHPFHLSSIQWRIFRIKHSIKQLKFRRYIFKNNNLESIEPYNFISLLKYKFPLADVLES